MRNMPRIPNGLRVRASSERRAWLCVDADVVTGSVMMPELCSTSVHRSDALYPAPRTAEERRSFCNASKRGRLNCSGFDVCCVGISSAAGCRFLVATGVLHARAQLMAQSNLLTPCCFGQTKFPAWRSHGQRHGSSIRKFSGNEMLVGVCFSAVTPCQGPVRERRYLLQP